MTWIRTVPPAEAGPELKKIYETLYGMYPPEYHTEVDAVKRPDGTSDSIVAAHSLLPEAMLHVFSTHAALLEAGHAADPAAAGNDRDGGVGAQPMLLLNGEPRRVPGPGQPGRGTRRRVAAGLSGGQPDAARPGDAGLHGRS